MTFDVKDTEIIKSCPLFSHLDDRGFAKATALFSAEKKVYKKDAHLFNEGDRISRFGLVLSGTVQIWRSSPFGDRTMLAAVEKGDTFAESLCWLKTESSPVFAVAYENTAVLWLGTDGLMQRKDAVSDIILSRFTDMLARRTLNMNDRIQALSKLTMREKLNTFFAERIALTGSRTFTVPFDREGLAVYLGTNRSALSRELASMKKEGIIDYYKNSFKVL